MVCGFGRSAIFWSSTQYNSSNVYYRNLSYNGSGVASTYGNTSYPNKSSGMSVRCLRD